MYFEEDNEYLNYINVNEMEIGKELDISQRYSRFIIQLYVIFFFIFIVYIYTNYIDILEDNIRSLTRKVKKNKYRKSKLFGNFYTIMST